MLDTKRSSRTVRASGPEAGQSAVVARTARTCVESVRVPSFSQGL
jgi:hypothetical protein